MYRDGLGMLLVNNYFFLRPIVWGHDKWHICFEHQEPLQRTVDLIDNADGRICVQLSGAGIEVVFPLMRLSVKVVIVSSRCYTVRCICLVQMWVAAYGHSCWSENMVALDDLRVPGLKQAASLQSRGCSRRRDVPKVERAECNKAYYAQKSRNSES
jgi:hypothetical protein